MTGTTFAVLGLMVAVGLNVVNLYSPSKMGAEEWVIISGMFGLVMYGLNNSR